MPADTPQTTVLTAVFNLLTFCVGFIAAIIKTPLALLASISLEGATEVIFYGALGGIASYLAKELAVQGVSQIKAWIQSFNSSKKG